MTPANENRPLVTGGLDATRAASVSAPIIPRSRTWRWRRCPACHNVAAAWCIVEELTGAALDGDSDGQRLLPAAIAHALEASRWPN